MKFCKYCKHIIVAEADKAMQHATCSLFERDDSDFPVNGVHQYAYCAVMRMAGNKNRCGPDAIAFEEALKASDASS